MEILTPKLKRLRPVTSASHCVPFSPLRTLQELSQNECCYTSNTNASHSQPFVALAAVTTHKHAVDGVGQRYLEYDCEQSCSFLDLFMRLDARLEEERKQNVAEEAHFVVPVASMNGRFLRRRADELNLNTTGRYLPYLLSNELNVSTTDAGAQNWVHASTPVMEVLEYGGSVTMLQPFKAQIVINRAPPTQSFEYAKAACNESICSDDDMEYVGYTPFDGTYPHLAKVLYTQQASLLLELTQNQTKVRAFCVADDEGDAIGDKKAADTITDALSSLEQSVKSRQMSTHSHNPASPIVAVHPMPLEHSFPFVVKLLYTLARQSVGSIVELKLAETASIHLRLRQASASSIREECCILRASGAVSAHDALVKFEAMLTEQERLTANEGQFDMEMPRSPGGITMI